MSGFNHGEKDVFKAIGIKESEVADFWRDFIGGYICAKAKFSPEDGPRFLGNQIDKRNARFTAYCFMRAINMSGLLEIANIFNDAISSIKYLSFAKKDKDERIDPSKAIEIFLRNLGISREGMLALGGEMDYLRKKMEEADSFSKAVEIVEALILRKDLSSIEKGLLIESVIMGNLKEALMTREATLNALFMAVEGSVGDGCNHNGGK